MSEISAIPDIPLLRIFKHLPLNDLIHGIRLVCVRWRVLLPTELMHRRHLVLAAGEPSDDDEDNDKILNVLREDKSHDHYLLERVRHEDGSQMVQLATLDQIKYHFVPLNHALQGPAVMNAIPTITHLTVKGSYLTAPKLNAITRLLNHWSHTLVSLTIDLEKLRNCNFADDYNVFCRFYETINRLPVLQHLKMNFTKSEYRPKLFDLFVDPNHFPIHVVDTHDDPFSEIIELRTWIKLKILSRLSTLCVNRGIDERFFWYDLTKYGSENANLRHVCFHNQIRVSYLSTLSQDNPRLANCFTGVNTCISNFGPARMNGQTIFQNFCTGFSSLTTLKLILEPKELYKYLQHLRRLQSLTTLKLKFKKAYHSDPPDRVVIGRPRFHEGWPILVEDTTTPIIDDDLQLRSVRVLKLELTTKSHENIGAFRFHELFPNVQAISLVHISLECTTCGYRVMKSQNYWLREQDEIDSESAKKIELCMHLARQPLIRECTNLNTLEYNQNPLGYESRWSPLRQVLISVTHTRATVREISDQSLWEIFKYLSLSDLTQSIALVCSRWRVVQQHEFKRRHVLALFPDVSNLFARCTQNSDEHYQHLQKDVEVSQIPTNQLDYLPVYHRITNPQIFKNLIQIISNWSPKPISLRLVLHFDHSSSKRRIIKMILALFKTLNHIPSLRHLQLNITVSGNISLQDNLKLSFLSRLHTFCFKTLGIENVCLFISQRLYARSNENLKLCLHNETSMEQMLELDPQFDSKFNQISIHVQEQWIERFCTRFTKITSLTLSLEPYMLRMLSQTLNHMSNLVSLNLKFGDQWLARHNRLAQLSSVQFLIIEISTQSHNDLAKLQIPYIFPNIKILRLLHSSRQCSHCKYDINKIERYFRDDIKNIKQCLRLARQCFRACGKLQTIQYKKQPDGEGKWSVIKADQL